MDWVCPTFSRDVEAFRLLIASFKKFWDGDGCFHVIAPRADLPLFAPIVSVFPRHLLVAQEDLLGTVWFTPRSKGWYRQQAVKLGAANMVSTPVYGVIDADCFLTRPFVKERHATLGATRWELRPHTDAAFYPGAASLLVLPQPERRLLWRPPFFFQRAVVRALLQRLEVLWGQPWPEALARSPHRWGEVPLYHVMAHEMGIPFVEAPSETHEPIRWPRVDVEADFNAWDPAKTFSGDYAFGVIHTHSAIQPDRVREKVEGYLR